MLRISQIAFSIGLIALAVIGILHHDFAIIILSATPSVKLNWAYTFGNFFVIAGGILVLTRRIGFIGSLLCAFAIFLFSYILKVIPVFAKSSLLEIINSAEGWETLALIGGSLILANSFRKIDIFFKVGLGTISAWFLWAGIAHFVYHVHVDSLIPNYIPFHRFWTYFCGICLILASIGLWVPRYRLLTARLSAIMLFLWCIMLHVPNYFSNQADISNLMGIFESLSFAGIMGIVSCEYTKA